MAFYHNTHIEIEPGDIIKLVQPYKKCKFKDMSFIVDRLSHSGKSIWFYDKRTNVKCKCGRCQDLYNNKGNVNIDLCEIKLHMKKSEIERERKLKTLLKEC